MQYMVLCTRKYKSIKGHKVKISVIMAAYNAALYLEETLESVLNQTIDDYEVIVVNDGSKDNTLEILREYEKKYTKLNVIDKENG